MLVLCVRCYCAFSLNIAGPNLSENLDILRLFVLCAVGDEDSVSGTLK